MVVKLLFVDQLLFSATLIINTARYFSKNEQQKFCVWAGNAIFPSEVRLVPLQEKNDCPK